MSETVRLFREPRTYGEKVAAEVRSLAARRQVSNSELADKVGISHASMWRRMTGRYPFTVDELADVAAALGVEVVDLLPHGDSNTEPAELMAHWMEIAA